MTLSIDRILASRRIIITCGTGGVGKTTLSAAMAVRAALLGKKTVVITIDPAKRLATSLGLRGLGDEPTDLTPLLRKARPSARIEGSLHAIMPDTRRTFEEFVRSLSPKPELAERVIRNPIFQIFSQEFSGTNEYMAMQRLLALDELGEYDCIVLDTPPSRNTLAFLDAPKLLGDFFDKGLIKWLVLPANRLFAGGMRKALGILEKLTGAGFMTSLFDFASALFEVRTGFTAKLDRISRLLASDAVGFLLVTVPAPENAPEVGHFIDSVREHGFAFDGIALNRTLGYLPVTAADRKAAGAPGREALDLLEALQKRESAAISALLSAASSRLQARSQDAALCAKLPELARDVHSVEDLFHVATALDSGLDPARVELGAALGR